MKNNEPLKFKVFFKNSINELNNNNNSSKIQKGTHTFKSRRQAKGTRKEVVGSSLLSL